VRVGLPLLLWSAPELDQGSSSARWGSGRITRQEPGGTRKHHPERNAVPFFSDADPLRVPDHHRSRA
jgi:hypothetical protein